MAKWIGFKDHIFALQFQSIEHEELALDQALDQAQYPDQDPNQDLDLDQKVDQDQDIEKDLDTNQESDHICTLLNEFVLRIIYLPSNWLNVLN